MWHSVFDRGHISIGAVITPVEQGSHLELACSRKTVSGLLPTAVKVKTAEFFRQTVLFCIVNKKDNYYRDFSLKVRQATFASVLYMKSGFAPFLPAWL